MLYLYEGKTRRRAINVLCQICSNSFLRRLKSEQIYCSRKCYNVAKRKQRVTVECAQCGTQFERIESKLKAVHDIYFCSRKCKDLGQSIHSGKTDKIRPSHYGSGRFINYRNKIDLKACEGCGESRYFLLKVHHKDGCRENNKRENLEVVCCNCHDIRHLRKKEDGTWCVDFTTLTPRDEIYSFTLISQA